MKLPLPSFRVIVGSLRILGRRAREVGHPGLAIWCGTGERAAQGMSHTVSATAHRNECAERSLATRLREILADRRVTADELADLTRMPASLTACAERSHDIAEAMHL